MNYSLYVIGCVFVLANFLGNEANAQSVEPIQTEESPETVAPIPAEKSPEILEPIKTKVEKPTPKILNPLTLEEQEALNQSLEQDTIVEKPSNPALFDLAFLLDFGGAFFTKEDHEEHEEEPEADGHEEHGHGEDGHDIRSTGFKLQQFEITLGANIDSFFRLDSTLVFSLDGIEVEEAFGTAQALPGNLQVRFGQFLSSFGRQNTHHLHRWSFINQPLILRKFFGVDGSRGLGTEVSWLSFLPWFAELSLAVNVGQGRSFVEEVDIDRATDLVYTAKLDQLFAFNENLSVNLGLSGKAGPNEYVDGFGTLVGAADLYVRYRPVDSENRMALSWTTEFMLRSRNLGQGFQEQNLDFGGYTQVVWAIDQRWEVGTRFEHVSGFENDPLDLEWSDGRQRGALQGTFYPSHFSKIRLQTSLENIPNEDLNFGALISIELNAGAHGSHKF